MKPNPVISGGKARRLIGLWWTSPTLHVTALLGFAGIGFSAANLLLARFLSPEDYAIVALAVTLIGLGSPIGPLGLDGVLIRMALPADGRLLGRATLTSGAIALLMTTIAAVVYHLDSTLLALIFFGIVSGGLVYLAASKFQSLERFRISIFIAQCMNFFLLAAAAVMIGTGRGAVAFPLAALAVGQTLVASWAWRHLLAIDPSTSGKVAIPWAEALSLAGVAGATFLLAQLERLMLPKVMGLQALATFAVLASMVTAPFRMLQVAIGKTLFPLLRNARTVEMRRRILRKELAIVGSVALVVIPTVWYATPPLVEWLLRGKYDLGPELVVAGIISGLIKLTAGFTNATLSALGDRRKIHAWNIVSWTSVALAGLGAVAGARWGLTGVIYGVSFAWLGRTFVGAWLASPYLRRTASRSELLDR